MKQERVNKLGLIIMACLFVLLCTQMYWLKQLLYLQQIEFNKTINTSLEETITKEKKSRADSISKAIYKWVLDTSLTKVTFKTNPESGERIYTVEDKNSAKKQSVSFSLSYEKDESETNPASIQRNVATYLASLFRESYFAYQSIYYHTRTLGDSAVALSDRLKSDTNSFKKMFRLNLLEKNIDSEFSLFFTEPADTISINKNTIASARFTSLQTKSYKTDIYKKIEPLYIYATFKNPTKWIFSRLLLPVILSIFVLLFVFLLLLYFYRIISKQKKLTEIKNDFIDNMTHELKTPVAVIAAAAEAMRSFDVISSKAQLDKYSGNILKQSERLHTIINKVLDISVFERKELYLNKTSFTVKDFINEIINFYQYDLQNKNITINSNIRASSIYGDRFHLKNVLLNLVDNSIKYAGSSSTVIIINVFTASTGAVIEVIDNGPGIPHEYLDKVFEKFLRVPGPEIQNINGFGLGLFYCRSIVKLHSGKIQVESIPGERTCFSITLPGTGNN